MWVQNVRHRFVSIPQRFAIANLLTILFVFEGENDAPKVNLLAASILERSSALTHVMKHRDSLLTVDEKPDFAVACVKWGKHMVPCPQVKAMAACCFPDHDYADWHFGVNAVEQLGGLGSVPNEFTLEFGDGESTFAYGAKKVTNGHLMDADRVTGH
jgi:hypothetical protein